MKVGELVDFISQFGADCEVEMIALDNDNPLSESVSIGDVVSIKRVNGETRIVIIPM